jgi:hypothetical protein
MLRFLKPFFFQKATKCNFLKAPRTIKRNNAGTFWIQKKWDAPLSMHAPSTCNFLSPYYMRKK